MSILGEGSYILFTLNIKIDDVNTCEVKDSTRLNNRYRRDTKGILRAATAPTSVRGVVVVVHQCRGGDT